MCQAILQGIGQLDNMLQSQAQRLETVVQYCQALQHDQQLLIQGQDVLIKGQRVLLQEVGSLHFNVTSGMDSLAEVSWTFDTALYQYAGPELPYKLAFPNC